jgi:membrane fusion protein, multidrug efflux system
MNRRLCGLFTAAALTATAVLVGCGRSPMPQMNKVPEVTVVAVQPQRLALTTELPGRTAAFRVAEIRPQVNGLIQSRRFTEGSQVEANQLLYEVDPAPYKAAYDNAVANLASATAALQRHEAVLKLAKVNRDRYERLLEKKAVSAMDHDQAVVDVDVASAALRVAKASIQQADASVQTAKINLDYTRITSPITGRIGRSNVTDGSIATAYQAVPLATVQQLDPIYVDVPQSTVELLRLRRNFERGHLKATGTNKVRILLEDGSVYSSDGSFQFADVTVDQTTGSVILRIVVPNPDKTLLPGMYVRAVIEEGTRDDAILVPQQAVSRDPKGNPLTLVVDSNDKVQVRPLATDRAIGDKWLVSSGLSRGDRVILTGTQYVRPGMPVKVTKTQVGGETLAASSKGGDQTATQ